jgi:hypothetical protein
VIKHLCQEIESAGKSKAMPDQTFDCSVVHKKIPTSSVLKLWVQEALFFGNPAVRICAPLGFASLGYPSFTIIGKIIDEF